MVWQSARDHVAAHKHQQQEHEAARPQKKAQTKPTRNRNRAALDNAQGTRTHGGATTTTTRKANRLQTTRSNSQRKRNQ
jgi:hypothetical protein